MNSIQTENKKLIHEINERKKENGPILVFSISRIISYLMIFIFTPYGLYRIWYLEENMRTNEKIMWSITAIAYIWILVSNII